MARQFLNNYAFKTKKEEIIWEYHANGLSARKIAAIFKKARLTPTSKSQMWRILNPLIIEMKRMYLVGGK